MSSGRRVLVVPAEVLPAGLLSDNRDVAWWLSRMSGDHQDQVNRAIQACRHAGLPVVEPDACTCGLRGQLVVLARPDGLRVVWPHSKRCPIHDPRRRAGHRPGKRNRPDRSRSQTAREASTPRKATAS
jgi:hypothetical protein